VPAWGSPATAAVNGEPVPTTGDRIAIARVFAPGDVVELMLPMVPRFMRPDHRIDDLRATVAVERGPLVLCAESVDLPEGVDLLDLEVDADTPPTGAEDGATVQMRIRPEAVGTWPYGPASRYEHEPRAAFPATLIPYHRWAERGPSTMRVWLPERTATRG